MLDGQHSINIADAQQQTVAEQIKEAWKQAAPFPISENPGTWKVAVWAACQCKTQLEAALIYAKFGIPVFPCNWEPNEDGVVKKHPVLAIGKGGLYLATIDPEQITKWWTEWPLALIGVPQGRRVGTWALDVDAPGYHAGDGLAAWRKLEHDNSSSHLTRSHLTGTKGLHLFYRWDISRPVGCPTTTVPEGMEVKGESGYVIFPPSPYQLNDQTVHYDIKHDSEPEPAPGWLEDLILGKRPKSNRSAGGGYWPNGFGEEELERYCNIIRNATKGHYDAARGEAYKMGRLAGGGAVAVDKAQEDLVAAARQCGAPDDYPFNVKRSFLNGVKNPARPPSAIVPFEVGVRRETADAVEQALLSTDCGLFVRGGLMVRIDYLKMKTWDEKNVEIQAIIECGDAFITETIADICMFMKYNETKKKDCRSNPPNWIASTLKQRKSRLQLPVLNGVSNCPIMRANGELVTEPGYHKETGLFFDPRGVVFPNIPAEPTKDDALLALERIKYLFHTLPFTSKERRSVSTSALLTTVARRAFDFAPMHTFESPVAGTGKSLLTDIVSIIATGDRANVLAITEEPKEFDKLLSAELMLGRSLIAIDNCNEPLKSVVLNQTLSQSMSKPPHPWQVRTCDGEIEFGRNSQRQQFDHSG